MVTCLLALVVISYFSFNKVTLKNIHNGNNTPSLSSEKIRNKSSTASISKSISNLFLIKKAKALKDKETEGSMASASVESPIPWNELDRQWMDEVQKAHY